MAYYEMHQNNSGGGFDERLGYSLFIQADSAQEANALAIEQGVYFNGVRDGFDCPCCGNRGHPVSEHDRLEE